SGRDRGRRRPGTAGGGPRADGGRGPRPPGRGTRPRRGPRLLRAGAARLHGAPVDPDAAGAPPDREREGRSRAAHADAGRPPERIASTTRYARLGATRDL